MNSTGDIPSLNTIRKEFSQRTDAALANALQDGEYQKMKEWNIGDRRLARTDVPYARHVEQQEQHRQQLLQQFNDVTSRDEELARELQLKEMRKKRKEAEFNSRKINIDNNINKNNNNNNNNINKNNNNNNSDYENEREYDDGYEKPISLGLRGVSLGDNNNNNNKNNNGYYNSIENCTYHNAEEINTINNLNNNTNNKNNNKENKRNNNPSQYAEVCMDEDEDERMARMLMKIDELDEKKRKMMQEFEDELLAKELQNKHRETVNAAGGDEKKEMIERNREINEGKLGGKVISFRDFDGFHCEDVDDDEMKKIMAMQDEELAKALQESEQMRAQRRAQRRSYHHERHHAQQFVDQPFQQIVAQQISPRHSQHPPLQQPLQYVAQPMIHPQKLFPQQQHYTQQQQQYSQQQQQYSQHKHKHHSLQSQHSLQPHHHHHHQLQQQFSHPSQQHQQLQHQQLHKLKSLPVQHDSTFSPLPNSHDYFKQNQHNEKLTSTNHVVRSNRPLPAIPKEERGEGTDSSRRSKSSKSFFGKKKN